MLERLLVLAALLLPLPLSAQTAPAAAEATPAPGPRVLLTTTLGEITIELYPDRAPRTVENFLQYAREGHYNGTIFHRVIDNLLIQGGAFTPDLRQKPTRAPIPNEANNGLSNLRGTVAAARMPSDPHSATSQFFINVVDNPRLDFSSETSAYTWGYAVFGRVVQGMEVVDRIRAVETGPQEPFPRDVPKTPVVIERVTILAPAGGE
ncbi:peptidylprolyl isomerase [Rehaibacterium terrae]|uniref:Peptidyl-prolyl cis-trans isomerase n=1 Tax=Rehaibacterium terrae TaxID=1341696 RepID=A0A7W7Y0V2_9GAMM|nr:peptidylprolyl isomerase [Rehaibacterium terrae]MBB5015808.1 cyclophilin family peptidyl-prolyl cis-trans isomerase [Rehaibacterium terrae]